MPVYATGAVDYGAENPDSFNQGWGRTNALLQNQAQVQAGGQLADGDALGAQQTLFRSGNLAGGEALQDRTHNQSIESQKEETQFILDTAQALQNVKAQGGDPVAAFDKLMPVFQAREGADPQTISMIRDQLAANPDLFLQTMTAHAKQALIKLSAGEVVYDPNTMKPLYRVPQTHDVAPGHILVDDGGAGGGAAGGDNAPAAVPSSSPPPAPPSPSAPVAPIAQRSTLAQAQGALSQMHANPAAFFGNILGGQPVITSAERSAAHNAAVGGSPTSEHMLQGAAGGAWDFQPPPGMSNDEAIQKLVASGVPFDQIIDEGNHVHIGVGPKMRGEVLRQVAGGYQRVGSVPQAAPAKATTSAPGVTTAPGMRVLASNPAAAGDKDYTLGPGAARFDSSGKRIAYNPPAPKAGGAGGKLPTQDAARLKAMDTWLDNAEQLADYSNQWMSRAKEFQAKHGRQLPMGGPLYSATIGGHTSGTMGNQGGFRPGVTAEAFLDPDAYSTTQELDGITNRVTPMLRPAGSGRIMGQEYANFGRAFPSTKSTWQANVGMFNDYQNQLQSARAKTVFFHDWAAKWGNLNGADAAWIMQRHGHTAAATGGVSHRTWTPEGGLQ